jgi:hypothetical protein
MLDPAAQLTRTGDNRGAAEKIHKEQQNIPRLQVVVAEVFQCRHAFPDHRAGLAISAEGLLTG